MCRFLETAAIGDWVRTLSSWDFPALGGPTMATSRRFRWRDSLGGCWGCDGESFLDEADVDANRWMETEKDEDDDNLFARQY